MRKLRWAVLCVAAGILSWQLFVPPIVGLADQGDYARMIGRFGYGPVDKSYPYYIAFVPGTFARDATFRVPDLERVDSEYLFVGVAVLLNKLFSRSGSLDIEMIGLVHAVAFLAAFARLLAVTTGLRAAPPIWVAALLILTDVGYVAYWNSFYSEPSSCIFFLLLVAETIALARSGVSTAAMARWSLWAILFIGAKFQNFPLAILLAPLAVRLGMRSRILAARIVSIAGAASILSVAIFDASQFPKPLRMASTYDAFFLGILPESKNPAADLAFFHLDPQLIRYSGTGAWNPLTDFGELTAEGVLTRQLTPFSLARFWLSHPRSVWRRAKAVLPIAFSLRPEWCGNFERVAGRPPGARSDSFTLWSKIHERIITPFGKFLIILLLLFPLACAAAWCTLPEHRLLLEGAFSLSTCCLIAFLIAICGDAWDNVKHLYLFNLLLDSNMVCAVTGSLSVLCRLRFVFLTPNL